MQLAIVIQLEHSLVSNTDSLTLNLIMDQNIILNIQLKIQLQIETFNLKFKC